MINNLKILRYNPKYPKIFQQNKKELIKVLGDNVEIHHIGSTAVSGLGGKGIIDMGIV